MCSCCVIKYVRHAFAYIKAEPQAGAAMANQDWETKLENEMRIVRRLLWKIRGQADGVHPKLLGRVAQALILPASATQRVPRSCVLGKGGSRECMHQVDLITPPLQIK